MSWVLASVLFGSFCYPLMGPAVLVRGGSLASKPAGSLAAGSLNGSSLSSLVPGVAVGVGGQLKRVFLWILGLLDLFEHLLLGG